jgi:FixJ family two-component response regulator
LTDRTLISVVDDDKSMRRMLVRIIGSAGLDVEAFASAEELLESGHIGDSACLILDVRLPGINGFDLQGHLNATGYGVPIIFITTDPDEQLRERAMRAGAAGFFSKPFSNASFLEAVRTAGLLESALTSARQAAANGP